MVDYSVRMSTPSTDRGTASGLHVPVHPVRVVTATSLFDGHDAAINIMRRILQSQGAEVIHLGHNRSVERDRRRRGAGGRAGAWPSARTRAATSSSSATSSTCSRRRGAGHVRVYGGGGGVIIPSEIAELRGLRRRPHLLAGRRRPPRPGSHGQPDHRGVRRRPAVGRPCGLGRGGLHRRRPRPRPDDHRARARCGRRRRPSASSPEPQRHGRCPCSASPAPADRASRRSPTSCSVASARTRATSCGSR